MTQTLAKQKKAALQLTFTGVIWGFAFIVIIWALDSFTPVWVVSFRFLVASIVLVPWLIFTKRLSKTEWRLAAPAGILLSLTLILQTWGLRYTTATKSAFITTLYVLFVPLFEVLFRGRRIGIFHYLTVGVGLFGTYLICGLSPKLESWNIGDQLTLCCAVTAALHILAIDRVAPRISSPFNFNIYQSIWAALLATGFALASKTPILSSNHVTVLSVLSILFLALVATAFAFWFQIKAQKSLPPTTASMLFLLESPFSAIFSFLLLSERLSLVQWLGALLIMAAAASSIFSDRISFKKNKKTTPHT